MQYLNYLLYTVTINRYYTKALHPLKQRTKVLYYTTEAETFVTSTSEHVLPQPIPICRLLIVKLDNLSDPVSCACVHGSIFQMSPYIVQYVQHFYVIIY
jgi:hypothetical protein